MIEKINFAVGNIVALGDRFAQGALVEAYIGTKHFTARLAQCCRPTKSSNLFGGAIKWRNSHLVIDGKNAVSNTVENGL